MNVVYVAGLPWKRNVPYARNHTLPLTLNQSTAVMPAQKKQVNQNRKRSHHRPVVHQ